MILSKLLPSAELYAARQLSYSDPYNFIDYKRVKKVLFRRLLSQKYRMDRYASPTRRLPRPGSGAGEYQFGLSNPRLPRVDDGYNLGPVLRGERSRFLGRVLS